MLQDWFTAAKLGIFVHWGIYSAGDTSESWAIYCGDVSHEQYMAQARAFTAARYDPQAWADLFQQAGARYAVLTTKHHDGFALWDTGLSRLNAKIGAPAGRDLVGPYCDAMRHHNLKVGLYFSHADWSHPDYASIKPEKPQIHNFARDHGNRFAYPQGPEDLHAWERFIQFHRGQLKELATRYAPDLFWFDGQWERDADQWRFRELRDQLHEWAPGVVLNGRMGGYGDYGTPEQSIPILRPNGPWEFCSTISETWNYRKTTRACKSPRQCIRMLAECAGMGGNLLLNVGPMSDGTIPPEEVEVLRSLGRWTRKHGEAVFNTVAGLPNGYFYGASTLNRASNVLYLTCFDRPRGEIAVKGILNRVRKTSIVGGPDVPHRILGGYAAMGRPGVLWIDVPEECIDVDATVIRVELDGPLRLYENPVELEY